MRPFEIHHTGSELREQPQIMRTVQKSPWYPNGSSQLCLEYWPADEDSDWFGSDILDEWDSRNIESWFSTTISADRYDLPPGLYDFIVILQTKGTDGEFYEVDRDTFQVEVLTP